MRLSLLCQWARSTRVEHSFHLFTTFRNSDIPQRHKLDSLMLVYIGESGGPGFKIAKGSSPIFVTAMHQPPAVLLDAVSEVDDFGGALLGWRITRDCRMGLQILCSRQGTVEQATRCPPGRHSRSARVRFWDAANVCSTARKGRTAIATRLGTIHLLLALK